MVVSEELPPLHHDCYSSSARQAADRVKKQVSWGKSEIFEMLAVNELWLRGYVELKLLGIDPAMTALAATSLIREYCISLGLSRALSSKHKFELRQEKEIDTMASLQTP